MRRNLQLYFRAPSHSRLTATAAIVATLLATTDAVGQQAFCPDGLDQTTFMRVTRERFSTLVGAIPGAVPGSYAGINVKDADLTFASTVNTNRGVLVAIAASGGSSGGILPIIRNQEVQGSFKAEVRTHFLGTQRARLQYEAQSCGAFEAAKTQAHAAYELREVQIKRKSLEIIRESELASLKAALSKASSALSGLAEGHMRDSLMLDTALLAKKIEQRAARSIPDAEWQRQESRNLRAGDLVAARNLLKIHGISVGWWSIGYNVETSSFRLFDPSLARDVQLDKRTYASHSADVAYSRYSLTKTAGETHFWSVNARVAWENNLPALTKSQLRDRLTYSTAPSERVAEQELTVYQGAYRQNLATLRVGVDYYSFKFADNQAAVHVFPSVTMQQSSRTAYGTGVGLLLTARKSGAPGSFVNAELFFELTDITDAVTNSAKLPQIDRKGLWGRSDLGLRFSFPISFTPGA
jgi:hypothetical protein